MTLIAQGNYRNLPKWIALTCSAIISLAFIMTFMKSSNELYELTYTAGLIMLTIFATPLAFLATPNIRIYGKLIKQ
jgi:hypothetical protein